MFTLYSGCCGHDVINLAAGDFGLSAKKLQEVTNAALKKYHKGSDKMDDGFFLHSYTSLIAATNEGMGRIEYGKPNWKFAKQIKDSAALFAARKSWKIANELAALAVREDGHQRPWKEFRELALPVVGDYNERWLKTEHNTAIRAARQAALWKEYEETAHLYPNLKFTASRAATPREEHKPYYGVVRPITDDFWVHHTPPIDWNCLCGVEQSDDPVTPLPKNGPAPSEGLDSNPGLTGQLFSESHPYNQDITHEQDQYFYTHVLPEVDIHFQVYEKGKGEMFMHPAIDEKELEENLRLGKVLADKGHKVNLLPRGFVPGKSYPDLLVDGKVADFKEPVGKKGIQNGIEKASKQNCEVAIISLSDKFDKNDIFRSLIASLSNPDWNRSIKSVWLIYPNGQLVKVTRKEIIERLFGGKLL